MNNDNLNSNRQTDSIELKKLLIDIYKWHETKGMDYYFIEDGKFLLGIDIARLDSTISTLRKTNFFSDEFIDNYKKVGQKIDYEIKHDTVHYEVGLINFPFEDYDTWTASQVNHSNWDDINILDYSINFDTASFRCMFSGAYLTDKYLVKFKRVAKKWRLSYLQYCDIRNY